DLGDASVLEDGDALLGDVDRDEQLALRGRQRRAARRLAASGGRATLAVGRLLRGRGRSRLGRPRRLRRNRGGRSRRPRRLPPVPPATAAAAAALVRRPAFGEVGGRLATARCCYFDSRRFLGRGLC